ncbi:hypothetical protein [Coleofasciculus sp. E2-BRE-01]
MEIATKVFDGTVEVIQPSFSGNALVVISLFLVNPTLARSHELFIP